MSLSLVGRSFAGTEQPVSCRMALSIILRRRESVCSECKKEDADDGVLKKARMTASSPRTRSRLTSQPRSMGKGSPFCVKFTHKNVPASGSPEDQFQGL